MFASHFLPNYQHLSKHKMSLQTRLLYAIDHSKIPVEKEEVEKVKSDAKVYSIFLSILFLFMGPFNLRRFHPKVCLDYCT